MKRLLLAALLIVTTVTVFAKNNGEVDSGDKITLSMIYAMDTTDSSR